MDLTLSLDEYEALVALARSGVSTTDARRDFESFLGSIEKKNGITRYKLWIQWQEADSPQPTQRFPESWPPQLRHYLELTTRPIARMDVDAVLKRKARRPVHVLVTPDPGAELGWTPVETYFPH
jgi:hypothetical protein